nr:aminodeoxychorismate lyase [Tahibacter harae]
MLVNGQPGDSLPALDRGALYGDGLFETILFVGADAPLWPRHMARLRLGAARLGFALPDEAQLLAAARTAGAELPRAAVRLSVSRGVGERGYAPPRAAQPNWVVSAAPAPVLPADWYARGIRVRCCALRLAAQPALAGIKHANRLEQVLARAEWDDAQIAEGLLRDRAGYVVSATAANLFAVVGGLLVTPALDECGVAGVARAEVLARRDVVVRRLSWEEVMQAEEIFLTSSLRGIVPLRQVDDSVFAPGAAARGLQREWRALGFGDAHEG